MSDVITIRLQLEIRTRTGKSLEIWDAHRKPRRAEFHLTAETMNPLILEKEVEGPFSTTVKREQFQVESVDTQNRIVTYRLTSFARSDWFYRNIENFGFEQQKVVHELSRV